MSDKVNYEMANSDSPEEIIAATQRSLLGSMRDVVAHLRKELNTPGLTWEQIEFMIEGFANKAPTVIHQDGEM